jgi:hypothetical protein
MDDQKKVSKEVKLLLILFFMAFVYGMFSIVTSASDGNSFGFGILPVLMAYAIALTVASISSLHVCISNIKSKNYNTATILLLVISIVLLPPYVNLLIISKVSLFLSNILI